ncbi:platelet-derived growth factor receptor-like protein [Tupaia chinensis]|uniref:platelet-derived growth factor receptor-like protein n=1 Tax=Tupaia chinensis TaxID=246437 RepID=UPI0003C902C7|nr:platelet-derived growth factor receptor-like protein [Tupaia chinensis]
MRGVEDLWHKETLTSAPGLCSDTSERDARIKSATECRVHGSSCVEQYGSHFSELFRNTCRGRASAQQRKGTNADRAQQDGSSRLVIRKPFGEQTEHPQPAPGPAPSVNVSVWEVASEPRTKSVSALCCPGLCNRRRLGGEVPFPDKAAGLRASQSSDLDMLNRRCLLVFQVVVLISGQHLPKNKHPKEPGENRIRPANKKVKPKVPKIKDRDSADSTSRTQSIMLQVMDKGRLQKPAATLSLMAGQTVELRCKGSKIGWSYPAYLDTFKDSRLSVKQQERYGQLTLVNSTSADTGEFSCWGQLCNGYICRRDETRTGSTYIFFTEKGELFVPSPSYFDVVYLNPDRQAVVPCRVTMLSAKVTLHREFPAKEIPANGTDITYDLKRGFVYLQPHSDHQGVVYCKAEAGDKSQISVKYQLLYVEVPSGPPSTTISASSNRVRGGEDVRVLCTVLGEPEVEVEFRWVFPGQKGERPVTIQDTWRLTQRGLGHTTRLSQSVLTVEDFETTDAGYYLCTAQNLRGQTTVATTVELS